MCSYLDNNIGLSSIQNYNAKINEIKNFIEGKLHLFFHERKFLSDI